MRQQLIWFFVLLWLGSSGRILLADDPYNPDSAGADVADIQTSWQDTGRNREVPVKIYYPKSSTEKLPVIIFSHGLGGSREGYSYLGNYWASHGYVSVHLTHRGSDTAALMEGGLDKMMESAHDIAMNPMYAVDRCKDVSLAIDHITDLNEQDGSPLKGRMDLSRIGVAGHSFGGNTTMLIAGEMTRSGRSFADERVKCAIAISAPIVVTEAMYDKTYANIDIPLLVMTGTKDDSPVGETMARDRRVPFDHVRNIPAFLITFNGADHMLFAGPRHDSGGDANAHQYKLIQQTTTAFWDAYLRADPSAKTWLTGGPCAKLLDKSAVLEQKDK